MYGTFKEQIKCYKNNFLKAVKHVTSSSKNSYETK